MAHGDPSRDDLALLRKAYEEESEPLAAIARRFSLHPSTLRRRAKRLGWRRAGTERRGDEIRPAAKAADEGRLCPGLSACFHRPLLLARLYAELERRVEALTGRAAKPSEAEKDAKLLTVLAQTLQRLAVLDEDINQADDGETKDDARLIREELARRLSRLADPAQEGPLPGEPERP